MNRRAALLSFYDEFPFEHHPLWTRILNGQLTLEQVLQAEVQHWIRTKAGQPLRKKAVEEARLKNARIFERLNETYIDECTDEGSPNHLALIERLLADGGITHDALLRANSTPGNSAAIALYERIGDRGFGCHMIGAGTVEYFYSDLCPRIFDAYTQKYGMSAHQAETYSIHGPMDKEHAERAFDVLDEVIELEGWDAVQESVRDAFVATSLHYDGMLQNANGKNDYWNGRDK